MIDEIHLLSSTGVAQVDQIIRGSIGVLETLFPDRVRAYYLVGSYVDGGYTAASDIDLVPIFKGALRPGEAEYYRRAVAAMDQISPLRLGFGLRDEDRSFREGGVGIKIGSVLLFGDDVRDQIPLTPLEQYCQSCISTSIDLVRRLRGDPERLSLPLDYPDARDAFYGYIQDADFQGVRRKSTAEVFTHLMFLASTVVTLKTGQYNASKSFSWKFYQAHVGGAWGPYLEEWYILGKKQWGYAVPAIDEECFQLILMCREALAFENEFMATAQDYIEERLFSQVTQPREWAAGEMRKMGRESRGRKL